MSSNTSKATQMSADQKLIDGIGKVLAAETTIGFGNTKLVLAEVVKALQDRIALAKAAQVAAKARTDAVAAEKDARKTSAPMVRTLKRFVLLGFSDSAATLAIFGLTAPKAGTKTVKVKAAALDKSAATRAARHTMGSVQKKSVKGTVAAPAPSPAPEKVPSPAGATPAKPVT